jgi:glucokinase
MTQTFIGVDLGGTQLRLARFDADLNMFAKPLRDTIIEEKRSRDSLIDRIIEDIAALKDDDVVAIGMSAPGPLNPRTGVILCPPNIPVWVDVPLKDILEDEFGVPVFIQNDANLGALAEQQLGAARGCEDLIYITLSTGVGTGMIANDRLVVGANGVGSEGGHMLLIVGEKMLSIEHLASGPAIANEAIFEMRRGTESIMRPVWEADPLGFSSKDVYEASLEEDLLAVSVIERAARMLGLGIVNMLHAFNPEVVVIGGSVAKIGDRLFDIIRETVRANALSPHYYESLRILPAELGDDVCLLGAAALARSEYRR